MKKRQSLHWTVHCLGIAGPFATLVGIRGVIAPDPQHLDWALFDLLFGIGELVLALYYAFHPQR